MKLLTFSELQREIEIYLQTEDIALWEVNGAEWGASGWVKLWKMQIRDRVVNLQLAKDPLLGFMPVLTGLGIVSPEVDRSAMLTFLNSEKHLCLIADTSAVAGGVISWLARSRWERPIEVILPMVAERELFGWADQKDFWTKSEFWPQRIQYRLARRLSETPNPNVKINRGLIGERSALMLAKRTTPGEKSPDADILMIEMARDHVRSQPANVDVYYVTGDRNHARSAMATLSAHNVLFCCTSRPNLSKVWGQSAFWRAGLDLGAVYRPSIAAIMWDVLAATDEVRLTSKHLEIIVRSSKDGSGTPNEWQNPLFEIEITQDNRVRTQVSHVAPIPDLIPASAATDISPASNPPAVEAKGKSKTPTKEASETAVMMLGVAKLAELLNAGLHEQHISEVPILTQVDKQTRRFLVDTGSVNERGQLNDSSQLWNYIRKEDWDSVHELFIEKTGYRRVIAKLREVPDAKFSRRDETNVALARKIGQAAKLSHSERARIGDRAISMDHLYVFLAEVMPILNEDYAVADIATHALTEHRLTPARFERAIQLLNAEQPGIVSYETAGTVPSGFVELVWTLEGGFIVDRKVGIAALYFGGKQPIRYLRRLR